MGYTIRRWLSSSGMLFDDSESVKTADDAIQTAKKLSGICKSFINEDVEARIRSMEPGEKIIIRKPSLKFTIHIKRRKA